MINEIIAGLLPISGGFVLGTLFFGGLWFTVKNAVTAKLPAIWLFTSFLVRNSITLLGFYIISSGNLTRLLICVLGFIIARFIVVRFTKSIDEKQVTLKKGVAYEA